MAHGIEGRPVFLDPELIALAGELGESDLVEEFPAMQGLRTKALLRRAALSLVPPEMANAPKHPFVGPSWRRCFESAPGRHLFDALTDREAIESFGVFDWGPVGLLRRSVERGAPWTPELDRLAGVVVGVHLLMQSFDLKAPQL